MTGWIDYLFVGVKGHSSQVGISWFPELERPASLYTRFYYIHWLDGSKTQLLHLKVLINDWILYSAFLWRLSFFANSLTSCVSLLHSWRISFRGAWSWTWRAFRRTSFTTRQPPCWRSEQASWHAQPNRRANSTWWRPRWVFCSRRSRADFLDLTLCLPPGAEPHVPDRDPASGELSVY